MLVTRASRVRLDTRTREWVRDRPRYSTTEYALDATAATLAVIAATAGRFSINVLTEAYIHKAQEGIQYSLRDSPHKA